MTEPVVDARELLHGLHEHHVEYVLFGALAMIFTGTSARPKIWTWL